MTAGVKHAKQGFLMHIANRLSSPVVVIAGASSGVGRATAHAFAEPGAHVVLGERRRERLEEVMRECIGLAGRASAGGPSARNQVDNEFVH
jgi:NAD(P)-dependent dehydrogenase (short-subunit alcohol dehydrogenase family)